MECFCAAPTSVHCKIIFLDESELVHEIQDNCTGQALLDIVFRHLNLLETAYFGLRYLDPNGQPHWLDPTKKLRKQIKGADPFTLYFGVKFYAADPCKLLEEITRYQFFLQLKQDVLQGRLLVPFELAAELGAYVLQSELGDYDPRRHTFGYVSEFQFLPNQSVELEMRIAELHQNLIGQLPAQAELNYLDKVKWQEMYGVDLHPVLGEDHVEYFLGLTPSGIVVLRNKNTVGNYYWPRITKIYFKGRYFMLRVTDKNNDECTYGFETPSKSACKHLWKCCVEHHAFFRLVQVTPTSPDIFALGSRFRYSGRTEKQAVRDAQMRPRQPPTFERTPSKRFQKRGGGAANSINHQDQSQNEKSSQPVSQQYQQHQKEIKHISLPQPADAYESNYNSNTIKSSYSNKCDSPRSTRSAPWSQPHSKGLYNSSVPPSPRSVRSTSKYRSSSVDSQSSTDSRGCKKRKHRSRQSDNESEHSKSSSRSRRKHRRRKSRSRKDSGSEHESSSRNNKSSRSRDNYYELVDSSQQWQEAQLKNQMRAQHAQQAQVISNSSTMGRNNKSQPEKSSRSSNHSDSGTTGRHRHRKHRSRSRSPGDKNWLPDELKQHLEFDLVDTTGMSDLQLKEIPYTVVKTNFSKHVKLKPTNSNDSQGTGRSLGVYSGNNFKDKSNKLANYEGLTNFNEGLTNFNEGPSNNSTLKVNYYPSNYGNQFNNYPNFVNNTYQQQQTHKNQHEHSDSGLGIDQDCDNVKRQYKN